MKYLYTVNQISSGEYSEILAAMCVLSSGVTSYMLVSPSFWTTVHLEQYLIPFGPLVVTICARFLFISGFSDIHSGCTVKLLRYGSCAFCNKQQTWTA